MADKDKLSDMLDNLINNKGEQAQVDFHDYLQDKIQDVQTDEPVQVEPEPEIEEPND